MRLRSTRKLTYNGKRSLQLLFEVLDQDEGASKSGRVDGVEKEDVDIRKIAECQVQEAGQSTSTNFALQDGQSISALQISQMTISREYANQLVLWLVKHCGEEVG